MPVWILSPPSTKMKILKNIVQGLQKRKFKNAGQSPTLAQARNLIFFLENICEF